MTEVPLPAIRYTLRVRSDRIDSVAFRHPWLFSGTILRVPSDIREGELVMVTTADGELIGTGYFGNKSIAVRMLTWHEPLTIAVLGQRLKTAANLRARLGLPNTNTNGYRLINGEGDELPGLIVDRYDNTLVIEVHTVGMANLLPTVLGLCQKLFGPTLDRIVVLERFAATRRRFTAFGNQVDTVTFREDGNIFFADLAQGQKTGFFVDQRENRQLLKSLAGGRSVLNLFAYTGGFSVAALRGGATDVISVDSSARALALLDETLAINSLKGRSHTTVRDDVFKYLNRSSSQFDIVIVDPPAFAKHRTANRSARRGYTDLIYAASRAVAPRGLMLVFSCSQVVTVEEFRDAVTAGLIRRHRYGTIVATLGAAKCHPVALSHREGNYLKGFLVQLLN